MNTQSISGRKKGSWRVIPIGKDAAEVISPKARYIVTAAKTSFTLRAFEGRRVVEKHSLRHVGHNYMLQGTDSRGVTERLTLSLTRKRMITRGVVGGRRFTVESKPYVHAPMLVEALRNRRRISLPLTHAFAERLREDAGFRTQLYRQVSLRRPLKQPDWVDQACAIACTLCYLLGEPLSCVICSLCTEPDPILTARAAARSASA
jgi:hypothetical protein